MYEERSCCEFVESHFVKKVLVSSMLAQQLNHGALPRVRACGPNFEMLL